MMFTAGTFYDWQWTWVWFPASFFGVSNSAAAWPRT